MKKLSLLTAALLCCSLAFAQEAEESEGTFLIIPRIDANPYLSGSGSNFTGSNFSLGHTSLYTLFEGNIGNSNFSYSVEGHLLSSDPASLYSNMGLAGEESWLDWANITYTKGLFDFTVGKDVLAIGGFEYDEYDFDSHPDFNSTVWNALPVYQWGARAGVNLFDESLYLAGQVATSPFSEKYFDGSYAYSLYANGEFGNYSAIWSANLLQTMDGDFAKSVAFGNRVSLGDVDLTLDYIARGYSSLFDEQTLSFTALWNASDKFNVSARIGAEYSGLNFSEVFGWNPVEYLENPHDYFVPASLAWTSFNSSAFSYMYGGVAAHYNILDDLRLHAVASYNNWSRSLSLNVGATYFFDLSRFFK